MSPQNGRAFQAWVVTAIVFLLFCAGPLAAQWQIKSDDGKTSIKFGFLAQARGEMLDNASASDQSTDLFFRRFRILFGGKATEKISFFFETDSPNLGKAGAGGTKGTSDVYIQDMVLTYNASDALNVDVGMLLNAESYNSNQSATSLMAVDYGPYSFLHSGPLDLRVGRDYGVRARGYVLGDHLEYRAGVYDGLRENGSTNGLRFMGRLMYNVFEAQKGLFYQGTSLGKKKLLSFGVSYDTQSSYDAVGVDAYLDWPMPGGNGLTAQADWVSYDGGDFIPSFVKQDETMVEAGYYIGGPHLLPFVQWAKRNYDPAGLVDEDQLQIGLGYMFDGHNANLKSSYARISKDGSPDRDQFWLQFQVFRF